MFRFVLSFSFAGGGIMTTKSCKSCGADFPHDSGFYANDNTCKECRKARVRENRKEKIEYYREYDRKRSNRPDRVAARKEYAKTPEGISAANAAKKRHAEKNRAKKVVSQMVNNAVRDGKLKKLYVCQSCNKTGCRIEGHHDDYRYPMDVRWLCSSCHRAWHKKNGPGAGI